MKISLNWISDYIDLTGIDAKELANKLTLSTAEVDDVIEIGKDINNVVVGKVIEVQPHPSSKKLKIVKVDVGNEIVQSVCGAPNVEIGMVIPFAMVGGSIKGLAKVEKCKLAGEESNGICCSAKEIGISDDHSGLFILKGNHKLGTDIKKIIDIDDVIIDIDNKAITNRPDLWGHYGVAREIGALIGRKMKPLELDELPEAEGLPKVNVTVEDKEKCLRYSCISIENITKKSADLKMQTRLYYCGMRPISLLVDLTNYLMLETGQPMHAFDKTFIQKIVVKSTKEPIKFRTLDSIEREIPEDVLMICNQKGPLGIAGVMGGENSEVGEDTTSIVLESATFEGPSTRKNASKMGLRTEASARFEKMLDPELTVVALKRFIKLLKEVDKNAKVTSALTDVYSKKAEKIKVEVDKKYIDKYIGYNLENEKIVNILESLEFIVSQKGDKYRVEVPSFRATKDVTMKADIVEEIARIHGYNNIEPKTTNVVLEPLNFNEERIIDNKVKEMLAENYGLSEVHSYIWYDNKENVRLGIGARDGLKLLNPGAEHMNVLRDSIAPTLINMTAENRKNFDEFGIFEIGSVFNLEHNSTDYSENKNLGTLIASKKHTEDKLFYKAKAIVSSIFRVVKKAEPRFVYSNETLNYSWVHPVKSAEIICNGENFGYVTIIHPRIKENIDKKLAMVIIELNMFKLHNIEMEVIQYQEPSKFPEVIYDLSILVDKNKAYEDVMKDLHQFKNNILIDFKFIDIYSGKGIPEDKKSMTFSFRIGSKFHTLTSEEIENFTNELIEFVKKSGYSLR